uniref:Uncharacterized protein n=1 Tax=Anguilla anguilla TaxID=7936 RepID=A0A0E9RDT8_ANGAN
MITAMDSCNVRSVGPYRNLRFVVVPMTFGTHLLYITLDKSVCQINVTQCNAM